MRRVRWQRWRRRELGTVEGYVFQQYSTANSRTTLWKKGIFDDYHMILKYKGFLCCKQYNVGRVM